MIDPHTLEELKKIPDKKWGQIYKELVRFADFKLTQGGFQIKTEKDSVSAEHFAALAIEKVFDGVRAWDIGRFPDITIHLKGIVKSLISSHLKSSSRSQVKAGVEVENSGYNEESDEDYSENTFRNKKEHIEDIDEEVSISEEKWLLIDEAFGDDTDGYVIFCLWLDGDGNAPNRISEILDIDVNSVYSALKKGKKIIKRIYMQV